MRGNTWEQISSIKIPGVFTVLCSITTQINTHIFLLRELGRPNKSTAGQIRHLGRQLGNRGLRPYVRLHWRLATLKKLINVKSMGQICCPFVTVDYKV